MRLSSLIVPIAVVAIAGLGWSVLRSHPAPALPATGDFYRSGLPEIRSLNPFVSRDATALRYVLAFTHETLVDRDQDGKLRGRAAQSWRSDDGGKTWIFRLREGLRFSDGSQVTKDDVAFTLRAARDPRLNPKGDMAATLAGLQVAEARDDRTLVLGGAEPSPNFPLAVGSMVRLVQAAHFLRAIHERAPDCADWDDRFVQALCEVRDAGPGTGPYMLGVQPDGRPDWVEGSHLTLVANPSGWQRSAEPSSWHLAGMQIRFVSAEAARLGAL